MVAQFGTDILQWLSFQTSSNVGHLDLPFDLLTVRPSHFLVKNITLQRVNLQWRNVVQKFFWLSSRTSSNVGHLDLIFYVLTSQAFSLRA